MDTTGTDDSNLNGVTVCCATRVSAWIDDSATVYISFPSSELFDFSLFLSSATNLFGFGWRSVILHDEGKMLPT